METTGYGLHVGNKNMLWLKRFSKINSFPPAEHHDSPMKSVVQATMILFLALPLGEIPTDTTLRTLSGAEYKVGSLSSETWQEAQEVCTLGVVDDYELADFTSVWLFMEWVDRIFSVIAEVYCL